MWRQILELVEQIISYSLAVTDKASIFGRYMQDVEASVKLLR